MPWDKIKEKHLKKIDLKNDRPVISLRIAFGACFIRCAESITDERTVQAIPYSKKKARKSFLKLSKDKKWSYNKVKKQYPNSCAILNLPCKG